MSKDCIFCKIIAGEIPADIVYQDKYVTAFKDIAAAAPIHILVIPNKHITSLAEIEVADMDYIKYIHQAIKKIAVDTGIDKKGFRIVNNCGSDGGQTVFHIHYHLLGGRELQWPPG